MAKGPEAKVKDKIINILKFHEAWYCFPATRGMGRSGVPDILVCHRGTFIAIEVKRDIKHLPTKLQEHELWKVQQAGGWACIIHNDNVLDLEGLMSTIVASAEIRKIQNEADLKAKEERAEAQRKFVDDKVESGEIEDTRPDPIEVRHLPKKDDTIN